MTRTTRLNPAIYFLGVVCTLSLSLNLLLLFQRNYPDSWKDLRLAFKQPPHVSATDHIRGSSDAPVTIIEYSDFQCPFCRQVHESLRTLTEAHKIRWVFRNRPLDSIHPLATKAALAAECAGRQNKFWEYADALFEEQNQITSDDNFNGLAGHLALDTAEFSRCQTSDLSALLRDQAQTAADLEIDATPTLFLDGKRYTGALSFQQLSELVGEK